MPVVECGEDGGVVGQRRGDNEEVEDLMGREEVIKPARPKSLRDAVRAA